MSKSRSRPAIQPTHNDHEINRDYLVQHNKFALENIEIRGYYGGNYSIAESNTRHLNQSAEMLCRMRNFKLYDKQHFSDEFTLPFDCFVNADRSIYFLNRSEYEKYIRQSNDISLETNVKFWRIQKYIVLNSLFQANGKVYDTNLIRRAIGVLYRSLNSDCDVSVSSTHPYLTFHVEHAILLIEPMKSSKKIDGLHIYHSFY